ncbi:MAG: DUF3488 domain-containing protein [Planctomycetes bacterium]|nr:DUF3488 domain-containing protein [Planctomycetota bacterium]
MICVLFQRRGLTDWSELTFLGLCIGLQETFLRLHVLRRLRTPMLVLYSLLPLALVLYHGVEIKGYAGDFVKIVLYTPLPLVLVSVQIMVLYVRESSRLVSVVLVLALFSTVIGVRRPLDDTVWPWLAAIGAAGSAFLMLQYPGMLYHGVYVSRRRGSLPPAGRPGGILRGAFFSVLPLFISSVLLASLFLYFALPRIEPTQEDQRGGGGGNTLQTPEGGPSGTGIPPSGSRGTNNNQPGTGSPASVSGLSSGVDLGDFGEIKRTQTPALDLTLLEPADDFVEQVYLRAFTYATFDGTRWTPLASTPSTSMEVQDGEHRLLPGSPRPRGSAWQQRRFHVVLREAGIGAGGQLPVPTEPTAIHQFSGVLYYDTASNTVRAPAIGPGNYYEVSASQLIASQDQLKNTLAGRGPAASPHPEYLRLPADLKAEIQRRFGFYRRFADMIKVVRPEERSRGNGVYAAASDIVNMFREATLEGTDTPAWSYSLDFRPEPGPDAIARFLDTNTNQSERFGHCEYFASAMCVLLRCYGVPARVAAGFRATQPTAEGVFEVKASSAHAWVEVYFNELGWLAFDPTPPEAGAGAVGIQPEQPPAQPDASGGQAAPEEAGQGSVEEPQPADWLRRYDTQAQQKAYHQVGSYLKGAADSVGVLLEKLTSWMPDQFFPKSGLLRALCLVLPPVLAAVFLLARRRKRKRIEANVLRQMGDGGRKRERGLYFQLLLLLARHGFQKRASETPREFANRVLRKGGARHEPILELTELYYALRFGLESGLDSEFRHALARYSDSLRTASAERLSAPEPV